MPLNKKKFFDFCWRWLCYEGALLAGFSVAHFVLKLGNINHVLSYNLLFTLLLITLSLFSLSLFAVMLRGQITITLELFIYLAITFLFAGLVNFQTVLAMGVILATTFLYECYPFCLRRWSGFFAIKYTFDFTAIFILGLFLLWKNILTFTVALFPIFYLILLLGQKVIYPLITKNIRKLT